MPEVAANLNSINTPQNNVDNYDYGDFDFKQFDETWKDIDDINLDDFNEADKKVVSELLKNKANLKKQLKHLYYLKSDDYYYKNKKAIAEKYHLQDGLVYSDKFNKWGEREFKPFANPFKAINNYIWGRKEAIKQWKDYNNTYDNLANKYNEYKTNVLNHITNLRSENAKHVREMSALKKIGINNPYYYLNKNNNFNTSLNSFGASGSLSLKSNYNNNKSTDINGLLKLLLMLLSS